MEMRNLQEEINVSKQLLEMFNLASSGVTSQKIHIIGDVIEEEGNNIQNVKTSEAVIFKVGNLKAKKNSSQNVITADKDTLLKLSQYHYASRFCTAQPMDSDEIHEVNLGTVLPVIQADIPPSTSDQDRPSTTPGSANDRVHPNDARKRKTSENEARKGRR
jgi:hypothetical protein